MDTGTIEAYMQEKCHGTNVRFFVEQNIVNEVYKLTLRCDFQGKTYEVSNYISGLDLYSNTDIIKFTAEKMIREMNATLAKEFKSGK